MWLKCECGFRFRHVLYWSVLIKLPQTFGIISATFLMDSLSLLRDLCSSSPSDIPCKIKYIKTPLSGICISIADEPWHSHFHVINYLENAARLNNFLWLEGFPKCFKLEDGGSYLEGGGGDRGVRASRFPYLVLPLPLPSSPASRTFILRPLPLHPRRPGGW